VDGPAPEDLNRLRSSPKGDGPSRASQERSEAQHAVAAADQGSAHLTLTGYGLLGVAQHTVTGGPLVGGSVNNPRDNPRVAPGPSGTEWSQEMPSLAC
jgi:hypothetical protein